MEEGRDTNRVLGGEGEAEIRDEGEEGRGGRVPLVDRGMEHKPRPIYVRMRSFYSLSAPSALTQKEKDRKEKGLTETACVEGDGREERVVGSDVQCDRKWGTRIQRPLHTQHRLPVPYLQYLQRYSTLQSS